MKKLYSCRATITDEYALISYYTKVVNFITVDDKLYCEIYRASMTTMSHIRKYVEWLRENHKELYADLLEFAYRQSVYKKFHIYSTSYNYATGEIEEYVGEVF